MPDVPPALPADPLGPPAESPPPPSGPPVTGPGQNPSPQPVYVLAPTPRTSPSALIAMILAALSFVYCPVVFAVVALVLANSAEADIAASNGWVTGTGLVRGARIAAWINIGLCALALGVLVVLVVVSPGSRSD